MNSWLQTLGTHVKAMGNMPIYNPALGPQARADLYWSANLDQMANSRRVSKNEVKSDRREHLKSTSHTCTCPGAHTYTRLCTHLQMRRAGTLLVAWMWRYTDHITREPKVEISWVWCKLGLHCMRGCAVFMHKHRLELRMSTMPSTHGESFMCTQGVHIHPGVRLQLGVSSSVAPHLLFDTGFLTEPGVTDSARLTGQRVSKAPLSLPPQCWGWLGRCAVMSTSVCGFWRSNPMLAQSL